MSVGIIRLIAVSYTHLHVYKRQTYGMPDLSESTGQGKEEEDGGSRVLQISGADFTRIEKMYDQSQEKLLDMGDVYQRQVHPYPELQVSPHSQLLPLHLSAELFFLLLFSCLQISPSAQS